ncbi:aminomethyltransferase family protein [Curvivirga aplysinae]|uniref:aminomethyltransferase family protein n=1 Tax=Curvivirga aplysinae TaxID=2529852 RepID=UPI0022A7FCA8|nr:aminomethyltransferase family protein [Curvivirga aplysinae]
MTPIYDRLKERGAVFGQSYGLEHALWFAPEGVEPVEEITFKRSNAFEHVAEECRAVREDVGMIETSNFAKYKVTGSGARDWINYIFANQAPKIGRMVLAPMLNYEGGLIGDFTVGCLGEDEFYVIGTGIAEEYHMRWFEQHLPEDGSVRIDALGLGLLGLSIAGPKSRALLQKLVRDDLSNEALKFMDIRKMDIGMIPALVGRVSFTGDLGYEIWVKPEYQIALFDLLMETGEEFGLKLFGGRALKSLSMEKAFGSWSTEYRPIYGPYEAAMGRFVSVQKEDFIGREAALKEKEEGSKMKLVLLDIEVNDADVINDEPIWHDGKTVGWVTSGGYAHHTQKSLALGYVPSEVATDVAANAFEVEIMGERRPATLLTEPPFDPKAERMRG